MSSSKIGSADYSRDRRRLSTLHREAAALLGNEGYRVLHLSDPHLAVTPWNVSIADVTKLRSRNFRLWPFSNSFRPTSHSAAAAEAVGSLAFRHRKALDVILLTGDLATTGSLPDLQVARRFVLGPTQAGGTTLHWNGGSGRTLADSGRDCYLMPGNHDRYKAFDPQKPYQAGNANFDEVFQKEWPVGRGVLLFAPLEKPAQIPFAILAVDFTLPDGNHGCGGGLLPWMGQGIVDPPLVNALIEKTRAVRAHYAGRVGIAWAIHFAPTFAGLSHNTQLINEAQIIRAAKAANVMHVFSGHTHIPRRYDSPLKGPTIHCAGSCSQHLCSPQTAFIHSVCVAHPNAVSVSSIRFDYDAEHSEFLPDLDSLTTSD